MHDNTLGTRLKVTLFGQSHGPAVGCVIEGYPAGRRIDFDQVNAFLARRAPGQNPWSTPRRESDAPEILSGLNAEGLTCGGPITAVIRNTDVRSGDYPDPLAFPRPGHADFTAYCKYGPAWDARGGGFFSARLTAPLCLAGALALQWLASPGECGRPPIRIQAHIARIGGVFDDVPDMVHPALPLYAPGAFPVISAEKGQAMQQEIAAARSAGDSVDGAVRCLVTGLAPGLGGPYFGGLESALAQGLFGIPAVKGLSFGDPQPHGSENNDPFCLDAASPAGISCPTNHAGGILGGISTGLPLVFTLSFKPTPSISQPQQTVNIRTMTPATLALQGRHDPCVVPRAVPVVEAVTALVLADVLLQQ